MKNIVSCLAAILALGCNNSPKVYDSVMVSVIDDRTDRFLLKPLAEPILALYQFERDASKEALFRYATISDLRQISVCKYSLPNSNETEKSNTSEDINFRETLIYNFYDSVRRCLKLAGVRREHTLKYSECYSAIAKELNVMTKMGIRQRVLLVYSDCMENNPATFSAYTPCGRKELKQPKVIAKRLEQQQVLPKSLDGIEVHFIYKPENRGADTVFLQIMEVYKLLLLPKGAKVHISATNQYFEQ